MRLFFALWPPRETAQALARWAGGMEGRAVAPEKVHLTLAFLGDADPAEATAAGRLVHGRPFDLPIDAARYWRDSRIVWVGPREVPEPLRSLAAALQAALRGAGFVLEPRPFAAHVTLVRKAARPRVIEPLPEVAWPVREFALVHSNFSRYEVLQRFPLEGSGLTPARSSGGQGAR